MDSSEDIARAVADIGRIAAVPTLLKVLCEMTGMRFAAVVRVTGATWTACAVKDDLSLGVKPGEVLTCLERFQFEPRAHRLPIVIGPGGENCGYRGAQGAAPGALKSFISMPIIIRDERYFGSLCALDSNTATPPEPRVLSMFQQFAALIAAQLEQQAIREEEQTALLDERATSELREQFIAILGHDLRNPLQAVFASADLLERRLGDPALRVMASRIKANVRRMSSLIDDVLDFARGRLGGGIGLELADVDNITQGLTTVIQELQDAQPECKILSTLTVSGAVRCDLGRLQQVASNLLGNALTHGRSDSPVRITARTDERDLVLEVWNAGEPIPAESLPKIFEPFWRHSVSASRNGLGLGLHICSQIVRAHDGRIAVTSTREHGTLFTARFPLKEARPPQVSVARARNSDESRVQRVPATATL